MQDLTQVLTVLSLYILSFCHHSLLLFYHFTLISFYLPPGQIGLFLLLWLKWMRSWKAHGSSPVFNKTVMELNGEGCGSKMRWDIQYFGKEQKQVHPERARRDKSVNPDSGTNVLSFSCFLHAEKMFCFVQDIAWLTQVKPCGQKNLRSF